MAPPRKRPLPPGTKPSPRKPSVSSSGGVSKHHHHSTSQRTSSKSSSSAAAAAAAAALAAGSSASATTAPTTGRSKPRAKPAHRPNVEQPPLPNFERMDNGMRFSSIPVVLNINQKNYYTDYLKKDDQVWKNGKAVLTWGVDIHESTYFNRGKRCGSKRGGCKTCAAGNRLTRL